MILGVPLFPTYLNTLSLNDPERPTLAASLADLEDGRFKELGIRTRVQEAESIRAIPKSSIHPLSHLVASLAKPMSFNGI